MSLFRSIEKGDLKAVLKRLKSGASLTLQNEMGYTPLHCAVAVGNVEIIRALMDAGADANVRAATGETPLHTAAVEEPELVKLLIASGADVNASDEGEDTAMHGAAVGGHVVAGVALLEAGADIDPQNGEGYTPLDLARKYGQTEFALWIMSKGAKTHGWTDKDVLEQCRERSVLVDRMSESFTPQHAFQLFEAVAKGAYQSVDRLLKRGVPVDLAMPDGNTALHVAANEEDLELTRLLVDAGADVNVINLEGATPLDAAVGTGNVDLAKMLIAAGANVKHRDDGYSALDIAIGSGAQGMVDVLLECGADTRGLSREEVLAETELIDDDGDPVSAIRPVMGRRLPRNRVTLRAFRELEKLSFVHEVSMVACNSWSYESYILVSKTHQAYALLAENAEPNRLVLGFTAFYADNTIYGLANTEDYGEPPSNEDGSIILDTARIKDAAELLAEFLKRRPKKNFHKLSGAFYAAYLMKSMPPNGDDGDEEFDDYEDENDD
ncbi:MAG TPA: ankyrin repeat domain-containing protein [Capsulimonadaceae bacterium]|jgi:ankyrin repeat protein